MPLRKSTITHPKPDFTGLKTMKEEACEFKKKYLVVIQTHS